MTGEKPVSFAISCFFPLNMSTIHTSVSKMERFFYRILCSFVNTGKTIPWVLGEQRATWLTQALSASPCTSHHSEWYLIHQRLKWPFDVTIPYTAECDTKTRRLIGPHPNGVITQVALGPLLWPFRQFLDLHSKTQNRLISLMKENERTNAHGSPCVPCLWCAAAAAKSLQLCPTLCDPIDGSQPGSPIPGILQARTLEWVALSFSNAWKRKAKWSCSVMFTLCDPVDCSLPGSSIHGIFQARVLEWGAIAFSGATV